jgi:hypothetical protein
MRRKSPTPTINAPRLLCALRLHFSTLVIDDNEMQTCCFEEPRELPYARIFRSALHPGDDVERHASAHRELALTNVSDRARSPDVSIRREMVHEVTVADWLTLRRTANGVGT